MTVAELLLTWAALGVVVSGEWQLGFVYLKIVSDSVLSWIILATALRLDSFLASKPGLPTLVFPDLKTFGFPSYQGMLDKNMLKQQRTSCTAIY